GSHMSLDNKPIMRVASIDIGSYSVRLTIAQIKDGKLSIILERGRITSLGTKVKETGRLQEDRIEETIQVLKEYKKLIDEFKVERMKAVATEAIRRAKNAEEFLERVKREVGLVVEVITPEQEGRYAYLAVAYSLKPEGEVMVVDQGGGSTEYVFGKGYKVREVISLPIGIVNLTETFFKQDPPTEEEVKRFFEFLEKELSKVKKPVDTIVGLGGTITTLAALEYNVYPYDPQKVHGKVLTYGQIKKWFDTFKEIPSEERSKRFRQVEDRRAKVILAGIGIFLKTLEIFEKDCLIVSDWGLREGVLVSEMLKENHS
uniref:exopolyphosphatase n=1 Tax=Aquifex aeolicus (strain VF5) TaxID=224324 RepID=UPI0000683447